MTSEPTASPALKFAVLHHTGIEAPHFDFLVETDAKSDLSTWRLDAWPIPVDSPIQAKRLRDHRRLYLDYTGPIPGQRGYVARVDHGLCSINVAPNVILIQLPTLRLRLEMENPELWWASTSIK